MKEPGQRLFEAFENTDWPTLPDRIKAIYAKPERALLMQFKPCRTCGGPGDARRYYNENRVWTVDPCPTCDGIGLVPREE